MLRMLNPTSLGVRQVRLDSADPQKIQVIGLDRFNRSTRRARSIAEVAEDCCRGRVPRTGAPSLSIHAFKDFVGPAERSMRRAPRSRRVLRVLRVDPLSLQFSAPPRASAASA